MHAMVPKILLAGCGLTAAVTTAILRRELRCDYEVTVWDKGRGPGGRMSTSYSPVNNSCTADLGAQYITAMPHLSHAHKDFYNELISAGLLKPMQAQVDGMKESAPGTRHFVTPDGCVSVVKHFLQTTNVYYDYNLSAINLLDSKWEAMTAKGDKEIFDIIVLTMPVPEILALGGTIREVLDNNTEVYNNLRQVEYSARFALGIFFDTNVDVPYDAKYVYDNDVIRFISVDNKKRGRSELPTSVVVHSSVDFGKEHVNDSPDEVEPVLLEKIQNMFPSWPVPSAVKCRKWRYSQVTTTYPSQDGYALLHNKPLLLASGDGFTSSNFDGCIISAERAAEVVVQHLQEIN